jgi:hypothetical protein
MSGVGYRLVLQQNAETKNKEIPKMATAKNAEKATSNTEPKKARSNKKATPAVAVATPIVVNERLSPYEKLEKNNDCPRPQL